MPHGSEHFAIKFIKNLAHNISINDYFRYLLIKAGILSIIKKLHTTYKGM